MTQALNRLPDVAAATLPSTGELILIRKGETGYYPLRDSGRMTAEEWNRAAGVTKAQAEAMMAGSMFGFHVPGADPDNYNEAGRFVGARA